MTQLKTKSYVGFGDYRFTRVEEFGYSFKEFVSGKPIPAQGAHINMYASGPFRGETMEAEMELKAEMMGGKGMQQAMPQTSAGRGTQPMPAAMSQKSASRK